MYQYWHQANQPKQWSDNARCLVEKWLVYQYWHQANQPMQWPDNAGHLAEKCLVYQYFSDRCEATEDSWDWPPCLPLSGRTPYHLAAEASGVVRRRRKRRVQLSVGLMLSHQHINRLIGLVVRRPPREWKIPGSNPACARIFVGLSHTSDLKIDTPVATLPGTWCYRFSAGTGQPGVSILWLGEMESLVCNFHLSVAARKIVWADPSLGYTRMLLGR